jgi:hypothetical protein
MTQKSRRLLLGRTMITAIKGELRAARQARALCLRLVEEFGGFDQATLASPQLR